MKNSPLGRGRPAGKCASQATPEKKRAAPVHSQDAAQKNRFSSRRPGDEPDYWVFVTLWDFFMGLYRQDALWQPPS